MKKSVILAMFALLILATAVGQVRDIRKHPNAAGLGCVDVTKRLNANVENGQMTVAQCCQGLKLIADVKEESTNQGTKRNITQWHVLNAEGKELEAEKGRVRRASPTGPEITETIIVIREPKACFIIDRKPAR